MKYVLAIFVIGMLTLAFVPSAKQSTLVLVSIEAVQIKAYIDKFTKDGYKVQSICSQADRCGCKGDIILVMVK